MKRLFITSAFPHPFLLFFFSFFLTLCSSSSAQPLRVLFLGNSYTYVNNLPGMLSSVASSMGDSVVYDSNCPGGYTLNGHSTNATSLAKIAQGGWDFVVLQEQSQYPAFSDGQVAAEVFPYARKLDSLVNVSNPCGETMFYMTWGRKNGDASNCANFPPICTYEGMDSLLNLRYRNMAEDNQAVISPVGAVRHYIRQYNPTIELYQSDESHPSLAGTYAAACTFYAVLFRKNPELITFEAGVPAADAASIRHAAKLVAFDSLTTWHIGEYVPTASFTYTHDVSLGGGDSVRFTNTSLYADSYQWYFGDGDSSALQNPIHLYTSGGNYTVMLISSRCGESDTVSMQVIVQPLGMFDPSGEHIAVYPNPAVSFVNIEGLSPKVAGFSISDMLGRQMQVGKVSSAESSIDISGLSTGIFVLQVEGHAPFRLVRVAH